MSLAVLLLTNGAISDIVKGVDVWRPVLQVLAAKSVPGEGDRVQLILSDGDHSHRCCVMVGPENKSKFDRGELERFTFVRLVRYKCDTIFDAIHNVPRKVGVARGIHDYFWLPEVSITGHCRVSLGSVHSRIWSWTSNRKPSWDHATIRSIRRDMEDGNRIVGYLNPLIVSQVSFSLQILTSNQLLSK